MNGDNSKISEEIAYAVINFGDENTNHTSVAKFQDTSEDNPKDEFYFRNGKRYIDIKVTDEEYKFFKQYATKNKIKIECLIKNIIKEYIDNYKKENINA